MTSPKKVPLFPSPESVGPRDWGEETLLVLSPKKYTMKKLFIKKGKKGGLQYHHKKDEAGLILSGLLLLRFDDGSGNIVERKLRTGDVFHFPTGAIHQEEALTDVEIIEVSTPHFNDRVRVEDRYGFDKVDGLQTTALDDVILK